MSELLPPNSTAFEQKLADMGIPATELPVKIKELWNPETCPLEILPWLAWAWSIDTWDKGWTERQKRNAVASALAQHKIKGTVGALHTAVNALQMNAQIQEWFNQTPQGDPYTFRAVIEVEDQELTQQGLNMLLEVIASAKNLRSHLSELQVAITSRSQTYVAAVVGVGVEITLRAELPALALNEYAIVG